MHLHIQTDRNAVTRLRRRRRCPGRGPDNPQAASLRATAPSRRAGDFAHASCSRGAAGASVALTSHTMTAPSSWTAITLDPPWSNTAETLPLRSGSAASSRLVAVSQTEMPFWVAVTTRVPSGAKSIAALDGPAARRGVPHPCAAIRTAPRQEF
jgi:hypothetical protein